MTGPAWTAATTGYPGQVGQVNQFLVTHTSAWTYQGTVIVQQPTGSGVYQSTAGQYLAQGFTTGASQTTVGQVTLQLSTVGGSPVNETIPQITLSLYATSFGLPTGDPIASAVINEQYVYTSPFWVSFPLIATSLSPSTAYLLVTGPVGDNVHYYAWQQSNQPNGALVSADGISWVTETYGLMYQVYDGSQIGKIQFMFDDGGARWTRFTYNTGGQVASVTEFTQAQNGTTFQSARNLAYSGTFLTGVS